MQESPGTRALDDLQQYVIAAMVVLASALVVPFILRFFSATQVAKGNAAKSRTATYTRAEVQQHNKEDDLWIILKTKEHGKHRVYNVTSYVDQHPGGLAIMQNAGGDSTEGFYGNQHPPRVFDLIEDFYIGDLADP
mmetsp:Transcript_6687/g.16102  ORF Transcript_6687/g.16102 Transcript_6687/m.16102 type:complete len:136 (+) Transcript_6687:120-527(+)